MNVRSLLPFLLLSAIASAQPPAQPLTFSVATVRPSNADRWKASFTPTGYLASGAKFRIIIQDAFGIYEPSRFSGLPSWVDSEQFDIEAKVDEADLDRFHHLNDQQRQAMLQALLADRFKMVFHPQAGEVAVYQFAIAKGGPKIQESKAEDVPPGKRLTESKAGALTGQNFPMDSLASLLTLVLDRDIARHVINKTGLTGNYDFSLHWTPENTPETSPIAGGPSIFTALQEQLGLKLEPAKAPIENLVIDHIEHPNEN